MGYGGCKENKEHHIHFRLTDSEMRELEMASYLDNRTKSDTIRRAINYYLNLRKYEEERIMRAFKNEVIKTDE